MADDTSATPAPSADPVALQPTPSGATYTYSGNPGSSLRDQVRFLIGDTGPNWLLADGELDYLLVASNGNAYRAAMQACFSLVAKFSRQADETVGQVSVRWSTLKDNFSALASSLQTQQNKFGLKFRAYLGGSRRSQMEAVQSNPDRVGPQFHRQGTGRHYLRDTYRTGECPWNSDWQRIP